jgi:hypothetical protein
MLAESSTEHNRKTRWESIFWIFFLLILLWLSKDFDKPLRYFPLGAAFWPKVVIYFMAIASAILFSSSFITRIEAGNPQNSYLEEAPEDIAGVGWRTFSIFITPLVWALIMHKVGFLLTAPFFIILFTRFMGVTDWRILFSYTICFYSVIVLVFYKLIFTPLPMGAGYFHTITGELMGLMQ